MHGEIELNQLAIPREGSEVEIHALQRLRRSSRVHMGDLKLGTSNKPPSCSRGRWQCPMAREKKNALQKISVPARQLGIDTNRTFGPEGGPLATEWRISKDESKWHLSKVDDDVLPHSVFDQNAP